MNKKIYCAALSAIIGGMLLTSCTNDLNQKVQGSVDYSRLSPVATPDAVAWSGNQTFGNTFTGTRSDGYTGDVYSNSYAANKTAKTRADFKDVITGEETGEWKWSDNNEVGWVTVKTDVIDREADQELIDEKLPEKGQNLEELPYVDFDFLFYAKDKDLTFEIYPVYCQTSHESNFGIFWYDKNGQKKELEFYKNFKQEFQLTLSEWNGSDEKVYSNGIKITIKKGHKFGFFWGGNYKYSGEYWDPTEATTCYSQSSLNKESIKTDGEGNSLDGKPTTNVRAGIFVEGDRMYLGLEDWTDFDYQDWVFSFDQIIPTVEGDNPDFEVGDDPGDETNQCPQCGHTGHNSPIENCPDCAEEGPIDEDHSPCLPQCPQCGHTGHNSPIENCPDCAEEGPVDDDHQPCLPSTPPVVDDDKDKECPACGHKGHDHQIDDCDQCKKDKEEGKTHPCYPDSSTPSGNQTQKPVGNEVEINLSILDVHTLPDGSQKYDVADLVSKLSMHVRYPHDIEVIIPVPESVYCDQDDLYILKDHYFNENGDPNWKYGGEENIIQYKIGGYKINEDGSKGDDTEWTVTLGVEFVSKTADELTNKDRTITYKINGVDKELKAGGYIRVYTKGINPELIAFLKDYYGDGINFEVYNYFNRGTKYTTGNYPEITYEALQYNFLSHSFVNFDWQDGGVALPDNYINAFNKVDMYPVKGDCYNWIIGDPKANVGGVYKENGSISNSATGITWTNVNDQRAEYWNPYQGEHYNGSNLNWIYTLKSITGTENSNDMPTENWPFINSPWQYYRFAGSTTWSYDNRPSTSSWESK